MLDANECLLDATVTHGDPNHTQNQHGPGMATQRELDLQVLSKNYLGSEGYLVTANSNHEPSDAIASYIPSKSPRFCVI